MNLFYINYNLPLFFEELVRNDFYKIVNRNIIFT